MEPSSKRCSRCGLEKSTDEFGRFSGAKDGLRYQCKACFKILRYRKGTRPRAKPPVTAESVRAAVEQRAQEKRVVQEHRVLVAESARLRAELDEIHKATVPFDIHVPKFAVGARADAVACALLSDWHVDEVVHGARINGLNEYSPEIARRRAHLAFQHLLRLTNIVARDSDIDTIWMGWLGDFITGWIHEENLASTAMAPGAAARFCAQLLVEGVQFLLKNSKYKLQIDAIPGNHGRMTKKMHFSDPTGTSLETFMYYMVAARFEGNPRVSFTVPEGAMHYVSFFERFRLRMIHGYEIKYGGGVGGPTIPINKRLAQWDSERPSNLTVMGHFHSRMDGGKFLMNSSLIGYNAYAQAHGFRFEEPTQTFFLVHARNGGEKSITAPIWVTE